MLRPKAAHHSEGFFWTFGGGLFPAVLQPSRGKWKNIVVLKTTALGMIALDSDNEAGYGNFDCDDAHETF